MKVGLFIPCYIDAFFPEVGIATLELLERLGCSVEYPLEQTCCGQPMANRGCQEDSAATEALFVRCFQGFDTVVGPAGSCDPGARTGRDRPPRRVLRVRRQLLCHRRGGLGQDGLRRVNDFHRHGAEYIASADMSCLLHQKGVIDRLKLPVKVIHVAQILNGGPL